MISSRTCPVQPQRCTLGAATARIVPLVPCRPQVAYPAVSSCSAAPSAAFVPQRPVTQLCATAPSTASGSGAAPKAAGRMTYRPLSFEEMVKDATGAVMAAMKDGLKRIEVEFPPVPTKMEAYKGSSDLFMDSNVQLAIAGAKMLAAQGKRAHVVMPDQGEYNRSYNMFKPVLSLMDGVSMGHLNESKEGGGGFSLSSLFGGGAPDPKVESAKAEVFIIINATCVELPNIQQYVENISKAGKVAVLWNLELDTLRGDLGLLGYPPKSVHYSFLSTFRPAFYLRPRDYSKSVAVAPFVVNYSGAMLREYPGPWQVMLKQDNGEYACIAEDPVRFNLGEVKEEMLAAMGLNTEEEGSAMQVLRRGLKYSTWFEDDAAIADSQEWRT